jgi:hypothetical protein
MWRPRDHERFIGGYDPEHEMPDPDRDPRDRWQSDAYRHNAGDGRWFYRWNPDRFEDRWSDRRSRDFEWSGRDRGMDRGIDRGMDRGYDRGYDRGWDDDRMRYGYGRGNMDRPYDRGFDDWDRDRFMDRDRYMDRDRGGYRGYGGGYRGGDDRWDYDDWRGGRGR